MIDRFRSLNLFAKIGLILVVFVLLVFVFSIGYTKYVDKQLKDTAESIEVPESWEFIDAKYSGNISCLDSCRGYSLIFAVEDLTLEEIQNINLPTKESFTCIEFRQLNECGDVVNSNNNDFVISINSVGGRYMIDLSTNHK